eukprot:TRINITY_DN71407_c0_g1_i1.p1 TRINITY_DN71407_c0_g1~~TRINITY_DN71407_c0_g1_i1.p1  ORF type:complete len:434 (-),score=115.18 TRINITY_DN71407_c0_g1_i1:136-1437(-)
MLQPSETQRRGARKGTAPAPASEAAAAAAVEEPPERAAPPAAAEVTPSAPGAVAAAAIAARHGEGEARFIRALVTPKISFSVQRLPHWGVAEDISQEDLRKAFLTRFPIQFDASRLSFRCPTPGLRLADAHGCVVFKIGIEGADEDRVLPAILAEIDKAYSQKHEKQLELAHADMLSSSMTFQVVADEIRAGQQAAAKRWEKEVRSLKDQLQSNQKRLFLLEQEKDQLQKSASSSELIAGQLRKDVVSLSGENASLKERMGDLESQLIALREFLSAHIGATATATASAAAPPAATSAGAPAPSGATAFATATASSAPGAAGRSVAAAATRAMVAEASTQTIVPDGGAAAVREATERWQKQLSAMSDWLQDGVALLRDGPGASSCDVTSASWTGSPSGAAVSELPGAASTAGAEPPSRRNARERWSELAASDDD